MHTYELPGSDHRNGCAGPVTAPKSQSGKFREQNTEEALFPTTAMYGKLSTNTLNVLQPSLNCM